MAASLRTLEGERTELSDQSLSEFTMLLRGEALTPEHPGYQRTHAPFNAMHSDRPSLIVRCTGTRGRRRRCELRAPERDRGDRSRRGTLYRRALELRRRDGDRPFSHAWRRRRSRSETGTRAGRSGLGRRRPGNAGLRACHTGRRRIRHGCRRTHARRRLRVDPSQVRALVRQRRRGPGRRRRRSGAYGLGGHQSGPYSGRFEAGAETSASSPP